MKNKFNEHHKNLRISIKKTLKTLKKRFLDEDKETIVRTHLDDIVIRPSMWIKKMSTKNGFVFNPKSVESLADALILLAGASDLRQQMGKASCELVRQFSCENFAQKALLAARIALGREVVSAPTASPAETPADLVGKLLP